MFLNLEINYGITVFEGKTPEEYMEMDEDERDEVTREGSEIEETLKLMDADMHAINNAQLIDQAHLEALVDRVLARHRNK